MSEGSANPDVVVVGMPSCGKTVFFTVLGKKFTSGGFSPLGFRMKSLGDTIRQINDIYTNRLLTGKWAMPTEENLIIPLRWEVFTGYRRIFELCTMDCAGEAFVDAFEIARRDDGSRSQNKTSAKKVKAPVADRPKTDSDSDDEFYNSAVSNHAENEIMSNAADFLRRAIETAKVVCFMVNINVPDSPPSDMSEKDLEKLPSTERERLLDEKRSYFDFRDATAGIYMALTKRVNLRGRSMIMLTQTHLHEARIERAGGPVMYLGKVGGGLASELSALAAEEAIPVIAVSAINAEKTNKLPEIVSPASIPSSGLFGFLLTVSGMVMPHDSIAAVKDAYFSYLHERTEYRKCPSLEIKFRLLQAERLRKTAEACLQKCEDYLATAENLADNKKRKTLSVSDRNKCRQSTSMELLSVENDSKEDSVYLVRDRQWDWTLRKAAVLWCSQKKAPEPKEIYDNVCDGMVHQGVCRNDALPETVCGFDASDMFVGSAANNLDKWIRLNLDSYRKDLDAAIKELQTFKETALSKISQLNEEIGVCDGFDECYKEARKACTAFYEKISAFRKYWLENGELSLSEVERMEREVNEKIKCIDQCKKRHDEAVEKAEEERRKKEFEDSVSEMRKVLGEIRRTVDSLRSYEGLDTFSSHRKVVESKLSSVTKLFEALKNQWQKSYRLADPDLIKLEDEIKAIWSEIAKALQNHTVALVDVEKRRVAQIRARRRRKWTMSAVAVVGVVLLLFVVSNKFCAYWNDKYFQVVKAQFEHGDYSRAKEVYNGMYEISVLRVSKHKYFAPGFADRLDSVEKLSENKKRLEALAFKLRKLLSASDFEEIKPLIPVRPVSVLETTSRALRMYDACTGQIASVTFDSARIGKISLDGVLSEVSKCENALAAACENLDKACLRIRASRTVENCEKLLDIAEEYSIKGEQDKVEERLKVLEEKVAACDLQQVCEDTTRRRFVKVKGRLSKLKADFTAWRVAAYFEDADKHYAARHWLDCIVVANKILALDSSNEKAMAVKAEAQKEVDAKRSAETSDGEACRARIEAVLKDAEGYAAKEWDKAEAMYKSARDAFEASNYVKALGMFENARTYYKSAEAVAEKNAKPKIKLVAMLNGVEKRASITSGVKGQGLMTPLDSISSEVGATITFGAELTEGGVKYVGKKVHVAKSGEQIVTVELKPEFTLPANVRFCGDCGNSLAGHRHNRRCPYCNSYLDKQ